MLEDFISIHDLTVYEFSQILDLTQKIKDNPQRFQNKLKDKILAMIFQKPSLRTRMTFEVGMLQLGGEAVYLSPSDIQIGTRETAYDVGKNLERWVNAIMIRAFAHQDVIDLAKASRIPVINALTDLLHPCQAMADFFTLKEKAKDLTSLKLAYIGDGNNVCHSLLFAAAKAGSKMSVATPPGYKPDSEIVKQAEEDGKETGASFLITDNPSEAVEDADAVYTDAWASMGQEEEKVDRAKIFSSYQVNKELMAKAREDTVFMHCLPAHRGEEVTDDVLDSPRSIVYDQAENRLHVQKIIMLLLLEKKQE
ncbi:MAG: ornithine carbamoyltransferase [Candidatus Aminicenantes bacterium]|nr:ornithine carbamoyltransferase [Candidatus Aminicenantes bacterium]MBL7083035.1 ornithine carbamoyltransferase [Candidatus Aminicenantes bacterium]